MESLTVGSSWLEARCGRSNKVTLLSLSFFFFYIVIHVFSFFYGQRKSTFNSATVFDAYTRQPDLTVNVTSDLFSGHQFPTPAECEILFKKLTRNMGTLTGASAATWFYTNLGTSSYFNNIFAACCEVLRVIGNPHQVCRICDALPLHGPEPDAPSRKPVMILLGKHIRIDNNQQS